MRGLFAASLASLIFLVGIVRAADDSPADEAIKEAITILEARKAKAEDKADQEKIAKAIAGLEKLLAKKGEAAKPEGDAFEITPAMLKMKFAGRAAYNPKKGELTLIYDFKDKNQLKDFELNDTKPKVMKGILSLEPTGSIRHAVKFKTLTVTGQIQIGSLSGRHFKTSEKLWVGGSERDIYILNENTSEKAEQFASAPFSPPKAFTAFEFNVTASRLALRMGTARTGLATKTASAGQLELLGGTSGGNSYSNIILSGQLDPEWAKEFFGK